MEKVGLGRERKRERESLMDDYVHARTRVQHDDISAIFQEVETAYLPAALEKSRTGTAFLSFFLFLYRGWEKFDCRLFGEEVWTVSDELARARFWIGYHSIPLWTLD